MTFKSPQNKYLLKALSGNDHKPFKIRNYRVEPAFILKKMLVTVSYGVAPI